MADAITRSARGEECTVRIPFGCNRDNATVVFCDSNSSAAGKGVGLKCSPWIGAYACSACHDIVDHRAPAPNHFTRDDIKLMFAEAIFRTQRKLEEKGLLKCAA